MPREIKDSGGNVVGKLINDGDVNSNLDGKKLAVIGYASQGKAQALCHRDSGTDVILGLRKDGESWKNAIADGWVEGKDLFEIEEAVKQADIVHLLISDLEMADMYKKIEPNLKQGATLVFSHGFNIHFKQITPRDDLDVVMFAPSGPGAMLRKEFQRGFGVTGLVAVYQNKSGNAKETVLAIAKALGATKPGVLETTFKEETESDLFAEQVDLVGGVTEMVKHAYNVLVGSGFNPVLAYWCVHHELYGLIAPIAYKKGNAGLLKNISYTAQHGALVSGPRVMDNSVKENMKKVFAKIQSGEYAEELMKSKDVDKKIKEIDNSLLETVGKQVRKAMWPNDEDVE